MRSTFTSRSISKTELLNGDCMDQEEFHKRYEQQPEDFKAELLDGIVFVCEPLSEQHGGIHPRISSIFDAYMAATPGVRAYIDATVILSKKDEVQPDLSLRIMPAFGGQTTDTWYRRGKKAKRGPYIKGAPELVAEIAYSSRSMDLHIKRHRYELAGVLEYIVVSLEQGKLIWFDLKGKSEILANSNGVFQSGIFPGFWIHEQGLLNMDYSLVMNTIQQGINSPEHQEFLLKLKAQSQS